MKYHTLKHPLLAFVLWSPPVILTIISLFQIEILPKTPIRIMGILFWINAFVFWFNTYYVIKNNIIFLYGGWFKSQFPTSFIDKIKIDNDLLGEPGSGFGLGINGFRIHLNQPIQVGLQKRYNIKVTPENAEAFLNSIEKIIKENQIVIKE